MDLTHVRFQGTPSRRPGRIGSVCAVSPSTTLTSAASPDVPTTVNGFPALVLGRAGLDPALYRATPLGRRMSACLRAMRAESETAAQARLATNPALLDLALNTLLIGVSHFFRDPTVFETLRTIVMPELAARPRPLRIASIGCSSGAELYSVAMLLAEAGALDRSSLLGIDCRPSAVSLAQKGWFSDAALGGLNLPLRTRYFEPVADGWQVVEAIRRRTEWRVLDATRDCPPGPWDLVLCRNLVIYLQTRTADTLFERLSEQLGAGGWLVVGHAERPPASLKLTQVARCIYKTHGA
jgi:chemotaxis protein methyltransferase CheR